VPLVTCSGALVIEALAAAMVLFPFPLRGVDFDNDGLFMNEPVVAWCRTKGLEVTRSRPYRENDQARVEQKNGPIVRRLVGYGWLEGLRRRELWPGCMPPPACIPIAAKDPGRRRVIKR
jgi:hypothetical protein